MERVLFRKKYGVKDGCFYFHFRRGSKNKHPATGARMLVYDWLLQKVTASHFSRCSSLMNLGQF